ncbi:hypothetical protein EJ08DRAFT_703385 [Tothia fuscella]|uniref:Uncharacterized protein n=1 Tax=Tothia fuscella TaxID=1048955 RepID=A0A9P4NES5_9PEZI|nr:hypothetical protein EJ08DRAFT_703385 [Tothia fuscella]
MEFKLLDGTARVQSEEPKQREDSDSIPAIFSASLPLVPTATNKKTPYDFPIGLAGPRKASKLDLRPLDRASNRDDTSTNTVKTESALPNIHGQHPEAHPHCGDFTQPHKIKDFWQSCPLLAAVLSDELKRTFDQIGTLPQIRNAQTRTPISQNRRFSTGNQKRNLWFGEVGPMRKALKNVSNDKGRPPKYKMYDIEKLISELRKKMERGCAITLGSWLEKSGPSETHEDSSGTSDIEQPASTNEFLINAKTTINEWMKKVYKIEHALRGLPDARVASVKDDYKKCREVINAITLQHTILTMLHDHEQRAVAQHDATGGKELGIDIEEPEAPPDDRMSPSRSDATTEMVRSQTNTHNSPTAEDGTDDEVFNGGVSLHTIPEFMHHYEKLMEEAKEVYLSTQGKVESWLQPTSSAPSTTEEHGKYADNLFQKALRLEH